ncbi:CbiX/SirB N-terminal domain-containing protein [Tomitella gaofuii]|uniref:sirohydrochlorin chelatase n=1 Tax=Tomitella gaofuii TaxID=2760083 RepID=UPI0015F85084
MSLAGLVIAAHGTRDARGTAALRHLARLVSHEVEVPVRLAFTDVAAPTVAESLSTAPTGDVMVVPAFLASGYHVHVDLPAQVFAARSPERRCRLTRGIGPHPAIAAVQAARLRAAGLRSTDSVLMTAVGSSDPRARADVLRAGRLLSDALGAPVRTTSCVDGPSGIAPTVNRMRSEGARRIAVAPYVLAEGHFWSQIAASGADVVAQPIGPDPALARIIVHLMHEAASTATAPRRTSTTHRGPHTSGSLTPVRKAS